MKRKGNFPYYKNDYCAGAKAPGEKSGNENDRRKHHHMVPVENSAGRAAAVFHEPDTERTPEKHADKIADIESDGKNKKHISSDYSGEIKNSDHRDKRKPDKTDSDGIHIAFFDICKKIFKIADVLDFSRNKIFKTEF